MFRFRMAGSHVISFDRELGDNDENPSKILAAVG